MEASANRPLTTAAKIRALRDRVSGTTLAASDETMTVAYLNTLEALIEEEARHSALQEFQFTSTTPVVGPILAAVRSAANALATKWVIRALIQQQNRYNNANLRVLREMLNLNQTLLARVHDLEARIATLEPHVTDTHAANTSRSG
jgi:hypothetical protein